MPAPSGFTRERSGYWQWVINQDSSTDAGHPDEPNLRPGPQDRGGHGGMATREQEKRLLEDNPVAGALPATGETPGAGTSWSVDLGDGKEARR